MWVKIDDGFYDNGKVIAVGKDARALYLAALCYANKNATRGFVPDYMIGQLAAKAEADKPAQAVERLCTVFAPNRSSLWRRVDGGFEIHDYHEYQPEPEQVEHVSEVRSEAGRRGGQMSAAARAARNGNTNNGTTDGAAPNPSTADDPSKIEAKPQANDPKEGQANPSKIEANVEPIACKNPSKAQAKVQQKTNPVSRIPYSESRVPIPEAPTTTASAVIAGPPPVGNGPHGHVAEREVVALLASQGISEVSAQELCGRRPPDAIRQYVADLPARIADRATQGKATNDPAGLLWKAIFEGWSRPASVQRAQAEAQQRRRSEEADAKCRERERAAMQAKAEDAGRLEACWTAMPEPERNGITEEAVARFRDLYPDHARKSAALLASGDWERLPPGPRNLWRGLRNALMVERGLIEGATDDPAPEAPEAA